MKLKKKNLNTHRDEAKNLAHTSLIGWDASAFDLEFPYNSCTNGQSRYS